MLKYKPTPEKNYTQHQYGENDEMYDVESLENVFSVGFYNPYHNRAIMSYIDDDNIIKSKADLDYIEKRIYEKNRNFNGTIEWENLKTVEGMQQFVKRLGITNNEKMINVEPYDRADDYPAEYYPVKDTDPDYDPNKHGKFFGYNTINYDTTMLAQMFSELPLDLFTKQPSKGPSGVMTAAELREFNDELFSSDYKTRMPSRLAVEVHRKNGQTYVKNNYKSLPWSIRKAWLLTNRHVDCAKLNEKMQKVAFKRLLGMLGFQILESDKLSNKTRIKNLDELADLLAYNMSDVLNLRYLFEHKVYYNAYSLKSAMLDKYKATIYEKSPNGYYAYDGADKHLHVRRDRLCSDSTSAKFVEMVIAPYNKLIDAESVSFMYPHPAVCKRLTKERREKAKAEGKSQAEIDAILIEPTDVLEDTKQWFEANVAKPGTEAHTAFMDVYNFYDNIRGKNFNASDTYLETYGYDTLCQPNDYISTLMKTFNTNLFYYDKQGNRTSCLANFSIGGIHGAEVKLDVYQKDLETYQKAYDLQEWVKSQYENGDPLVAINGPAKIMIPDDSVEGGFREEKIRSFLKSGSTRKKADWRAIKKPQLFKVKASSGKLELSKKYTYVSVGPSNHEDFTSYYPLLLSMLAVFVNPERGLDDQGNGIDPYFGLFETRVEMKHKANNRSLPAEEREQAGLEQLLMKLLLNAASGAADATFDNNIRVNNKTIAMRIIGQLFAWRIGQAQALEGARVPSTNTDGLYTMDISWELNNKILFDIADSMYIGIEPERITRFVSKDSNNRMEYSHVPTDKDLNLLYDQAPKTIASAKGGNLNSWGGPWPEQSLDHPAAIDTALAFYLAEHDDPSNSEFDSKLAQSIFSRIITDNKETPQEALRFFQWVLASSSGTHRYVFTQTKNIHTGEIIRTDNLQHYNRIFLTRPRGNELTTVAMATRRKIQEASLKKRIKDNEPVVQHDDTAVYILKENGYDIINNPDVKYDEAQTIKIKSMPVDQNIEVVNNDLFMMSNAEAFDLISRLDPNAYISIIEATFLKSWSNIA